LYKGDDSCPSTEKKKKEEPKMQYYSRERRIYCRPNESNDSHLSLGESLLRDLRTLAIQEDEQEVASITESLDSMRSEERSIAESLITQSSSGNYFNVNSDERRLYQRQKQIDYGKNTIGYNRYISLVPVSKRSKQDPVTPDKRSKCSKRSWDGIVRTWRRKLHLWDPPEGVEREIQHVEISTQTVELRHFF
jgi:hypothetical protein